VQEKRGAKIGKDEDIQDEISPQADTESLRDPLREVRVGDRRCRTGPDRGPDQGEPAPAQAAAQAHPLSNEEQAQERQRQPLKGCHRIILLRSKSPRMASALPERWPFARLSAE